MFSLLRMGLHLWTGCPAAPPGSAVLTGAGSPWAFGNAWEMPRITSGVVGNTGADNHPGNRLCLLALRHL